MVDAHEREVREIRSSGLFDEKWYLARYPDVEILQMDPVEHYFVYGAALGRDPSPGFDTVEYLETHRELLRGGVNPLLHHLRDVGTPAARQPVGGVEEASAARLAPPLVRRRVAVVIPVYNAPTETALCIRSVLSHTHPSVRIIVIDDASSDARVGVALAELSGRPNVLVMRNHENLGYTATINRSIVLAGRADVVLLNSDTRVTPQWLRNLRLAAYSDPKVATATPFSDNAGAFSAPRVNERNPRDESMSDDEYARCVNRASERTYPAVPTGSGYCMYVRRAAMDEIGVFDADAFPRGYGEENDFCMRATQAGWIHVIDDATLVYHARSASFGSERDALVKKGRAIVDARYPDYKSRVQAFLADRRIEEARQRVGSAANSRSEPARPRALFVISTTTGGTPQTNGDLMQALQGSYETYLLTCDSRKVRFQRVTDSRHETMEVHDLDEPIMPFPHVSEEYDALLNRLLVEYSVELVHIRHIAWHSLNLPRICADLDVPVVFSFHDFYSICPTIKLLDENFTYCGGVCTSTSGECRPDYLWNRKDFPKLKHEGVYSWQDRMREMLSYCDAFVTTSNSARAQMLTNFTELEYRPFFVIPHGRNLTFERLATDQDEVAKPTKIIVPGNITVAKGMLLLDQLRLIDSERCFEFHVLGRTSIKAGEGLVVHGAYDRDSFARIVKEIGPSHGMILSIWPETHCHTLTELWACGLPVIALDFGAIGERIRRHDGGWLLAYGSVEALYARLKEICADREGYGHRVRSVWRWQDGTGRTEDTRWMATKYAAVYRSLLHRSRLPTIPVQDDSSRADELV